MPFLPESSSKEKNRFSRTIQPLQSVKPDYIDITRPFSNFDFIERNFSGLDTLRRLMSQVRQHDGKTMVIEKINESEDISQENEDIRNIYPDFKESRIFRLSFFTKKFSTRRGLNHSTSEDFIGYIIVKEDNISGEVKNLRIYESVIKPSRIVNNYIRGDKEWFCSIAGNDLIVKGYLYAQQNNITNCCAHVALRTASSCFHKDGDMTYREMNKIIGIDHINRKIGDGSGLTSKEMVTILEASGAKSISVDYTKLEEKQLPFQKYLYGSVESGFPAIALFQMANNPAIGHAVPIFGHTFNEDTWVYRAESSYFKVGKETTYIPSESWVSMYIGHDDNWGSNFCIPRDYLHTRKLCEMTNDKNIDCPLNKGCLSYIIGTLPKEVQMNAIEAEVIGADYLFTILPQIPNVRMSWIQRLIQYALMNQLILRPVLLKGEDYTNHLKKIRDWENNKLDISEVFAPNNWFWMVELSVPELFSANRRKVAEVILKASIEPKTFRDFKNFVFARLPGYFALNIKGGAANPRYSFIPSTLRSHVELYGCEETN
jgi:hypothetical protein